jgi:phosphatidylglycerol:prolipoprotein diacylglycerol transferase
MHPILVRIPLPHGPLKLWWGLVAITILAFAYAGWSQRQKDTSGALVSVVVGMGAGLGAYFARGVTYEAPNLPLYSYGVMLGLSLVVGWYLTLGLAQKDGLPAETMANCYVITAVAAIAGSRILYVLTNLDQFHSVADVFKFRLGGLVAYGGFLGGFVGSWFYLSSKRIRLMPWADVAVPSLASGLMITRIGCYLFGCDFGKRLPESAPQWLQRMGTFPKWDQGVIDSAGSPAYERHMEVFRGTPLAQVLTKTNASLPVHPTQIYESLVGLALLVILLMERKRQKFRGQIFLTFVFLYGYARFLLELLRDDVERGELPPTMAEHVLVPGSMLLMSLGFVFGIATTIKNPALRTTARVLAFVPPIVAYVAMKPPSFGASVSVQLSTSQGIGLITAVLASFFYARFWEDARKQPKVAMSKATLGPGAVEEEERAKKKKKRDEAEEAEGDEEEPADTGAEDEAALVETKAEVPRSKKRRPAAGEEPDGDSEAPEGDGTPAPEG